MLRAPSNDETGYRIVPLADAANQLNERYAWGEDPEQYFNLFNGILDAETDEFRFGTAGHPGPVNLSVKRSQDRRPHGLLYRLDPRPRLRRKYS